MPKRIDEISLLRPAMSMKSIYLSTKHQPKSKVRFPIRAAPSARMNIASDAELKLGGRMILGLSPELHEGPEADFEPQTDERSRVIMRARSRLETHGWVIISPGAQVIVAEGGSIELGQGHHSSPGSTIICRSSVTLGGDGGISWGALVMDSNFHPIFKNEVPSSIDDPITIGKHVFIGARAIVLKGSTIGDGAIIAAGSVVSGEIPPNVLAGGVPAKVLQENVRWEW
ncbi:MAG TPA: acyltransferase [Actinomycetota bacterium]|nr:acyltransferase [Actinomycetota bacterium]